MDELAAGPELAQAGAAMMSGDGTEDKPRRSANKRAGGERTTRTRHLSKSRQHHLRSAVAALAQQARCSRELTTILALTESGTRKILRYLRKRGIVEVCGEAGEPGALSGKPLYRVCAAPDEVAHFLDSLLLPTVLQPLPAAPAEHRPARAGILLHIMDYDMPYRIRANRNRVGRDPLVSALFGPPGA
jgi:hypothetical protein